MQFGPFISQEEKNAINEAMYRNSGGVTADPNFLKNGGRSSVKRREIEAAKERRQNPKPKPISENSASRQINPRDARRGGGLKNRNPFELPATLKTSPIKGRGGAQSKTTGMVRNLDGRLVPGEMPASRNTDLVSVEPERKPETTEEQEVIASRLQFAPDGSGAVGTNTGFNGYNIDLNSANSLLGGLKIGNIADVNNFVSNSLPTVDISGSEFDATQRADGTFNAPQKVIVGGKAVNFSDLDGALSNTVVEGISTPGDTGISAADTADNNRSLSIPGENPTNWMKPRQKDFSELRKEAFLDPNNRGYAAIRAADAAVGRFRQGDKFFVNDGGELKEINEDAWRTGQHRQLTTDELKGAYVGGVKDSLVPVAESGVFGESLGIGTPSDILQQKPGNVGTFSEIEFNMNNQMPTGSISKEDMKIGYFAGRGLSEDDEED